MNNVPTTRGWSAGIAPVAVVMISLNEGHNMEVVLRNLAGWAQQVFLVDSFSNDDTVDIALRHGVHVVQHSFRSFGDQWNFALRELPITAPWTMKLDPDERLSDELKSNLVAAIQRDDCNGVSMVRRLWFMGRPLPVRQTLIRLWRTGNCKFTDVLVNEHPIVSGRIAHVRGEMPHYDSPDLEHWLEKQNKYTTAEAIMAHQGHALAGTPRLLGSAFERRMWVKKYFDNIPFRLFMLFVYHWIAQGAWRAGWVGYAWSRLRCDVMRFREYKRREMEITGRLPVTRQYGAGQPDPRVRQYSPAGGGDANAGALQYTMPAGALFHEAISPGWSIGYGKPSFQKRQLVFHELLANAVSSGSHWLDLGCGSGVLTKDLLSLGAAVVAIDGSPAMISEAQNSMMEPGMRVTWLVNDVHSIPQLPDQSFDGVLCSSVIEYLERPHDALREIARLLKPGGKLIFSAPPKWALVRIVQKLTRKLSRLFGGNRYPYLAVSIFEVDPNFLPEWIGEVGLVLDRVTRYDPLLPSAAQHFFRPSLLIIEAHKNGALPDRG